MSQYLYIHDCTATPVSTTAYIELEASTTQMASAVQFMYFKPDASFGLVSLAVGAESEEIDVAVCSQKIGTPITLILDQGSRLSIKAIGSDVITGYIILCLLP